MALQIFGGGSAAGGGGGAGTGTGVNAADLGFDVWVIAGQSNATGAVNTGATRADATDARVWQYAATGSNPASLPGTISIATEPLGHVGVTTDGGTFIGPGLAFGRWYAATLPTNRRVLLVPAAQGDTPLAGTPYSPADTWDPAYGAGGLYQRAINQANAAISAAGANARLAGIIWVQGELDGVRGVDAAVYQTKLDALIDGMRAGIVTGTPQTPFIVGSMVPERLAYNAATALIDAVHSDTPNRKTYTAFVRGPLGMAMPDSLHYNAAAQRIIGRAMAEAVTTAKARTTLTATVPGQVTALALSSRSTTSLTLAWSAPGTGGTQIIDYKTRYRVLGTSTWTTWTHTASSTPGAVITGLVDATTYEVQVAAVNAIGTAPWSPTSTFTTGATAPPPAVAFSDSFNRADASTVGIADTGQTYDSHTTGGTWTVGIRSNQYALITQGSGGPQWLVVDPGFRDGTLTAVDLSLANVVTVRYVDDSNHILIRNNGLFKVIAGVETQVAFWGNAPTGFAAGDTVTAVLADQTITVKKGATTLGTGTVSDSVFNTARKIASRTAFTGTNPTAVLDSWSLTP